AVRTGPALPGADTEAVVRDWGLAPDWAPPPASRPDPAVHNPQ
ncbi:CoA transferase, partial [Streptomyces tendae]